MNVIIDFYFIGNWNVLLLSWSFCIHTCDMRCTGQRVPECQHLNNTRIYSRKDLAWFIIFVRVIYDFRDLCGNDRKPESLQSQCQFEILMICFCLYVLLRDFFFFFLIYCILWQSSFLLGFNFRKVCILNKTWAQIQFPFSQYSPLLRHQTGFSKILDCARGLQSILTQVSVGHMVFLLACLLARALVFSLLMAALSYSPKCAFVLSKMDALSLVCVKSYIQNYRSTILQS